MRHMDHSLFTSIKKYRPRDGKDSIENFITETFAWFLRNCPEFSKAYLNFLSGKADLEGFTGAGTWGTQSSFGGLFPDLTYTSGKRILVFEHKAWAHLHPNQLANYRRYAVEHFEAHRIILVTAGEHQFAQDPDLAICWRDIYQFIESWLPDSGTQIPHFLFNSFLDLLRHDGMGPAAPLSHEAILYNNLAIGLHRTAVDMMHQVFHRAVNVLESRISGLQYEVHWQWGRAGIGTVRPWKPGFFIGFLPDPTDHFVTPQQPKTSPDCCLILSFENSLHGSYPANENFISLKSELATAASLLGEGWECYNHLDDPESKQKNRWHPLYIRRPMLELLRGSVTLQEQEAVYLDVVDKLAKALASCPSFFRLREVYNPSLRVEEKNERINTDTLIV